VSINYVSAPFVPWWDESKTGPAPDCEICGAMMVYLPHPRPESIDGELLILHEYSPAGWTCMSCRNHVSDAAAQAIALAEQKEKEHAE
jgi:hypothetical protein